jgi:predicted glycosyltransferase
MDQKDQAHFFKRGESLHHIKIIDFDAKMIRLMAKSSGVVAMGGYNIFCEILSFNKPSLLIPRTQPRQEQLIRAKRAAELGLADFLDPAHAGNCDVLREKLIQLKNQPGPLDKPIPKLLDGLDNINILVRALMNSHNHQKENLDA